MKESKRKKRKELRSKIYRTLCPEEKEARRKHALQSFLTLFLIALLIFSTVIVIIINNSKKSTPETEPSDSEPTEPPYFSVTLAAGEQRGNGIAEKAKLILEEAGYTVHILPDGAKNEITEKDRANACDENSSDAVISIHFSSEPGAYYSLVTEKTLTSGRIAKCFSLDAKTDSTSEFLASLKTPAVRLYLPWKTEDDEAVNITVSGIVKYAEYAIENGIV